MSFCDGSSSLMIMNHCFIFFKKNQRNVSHNALCQNFPNGSAPPNKIATNALDKKYLKTTSPEPLVQIQNKFTQMFLKRPSDKIAQLVPMTTRAKNRTIYTTYNPLVQIKNNHTKLTSCLGLQIFFKIGGLK